MRFFRLHHPDELYVSDGKRCVLVMARGRTGSGVFDMTVPPNRLRVEIAAHEIHSICKGCTLEGLSMNFGLCPECSREVKVE